MKLIGVSIHYQPQKRVWFQSPSFPTLNRSKIWATCFFFAKLPWLTWRQSSKSWWIFWRLFLPLESNHGCKHWSSLLLPHCHAIHALTHTILWDDISSANGCALLRFLDDGLCHAQVTRPEFGGREFSQGKIQDKIRVTPSIYKAMYGRGRTLGTKSN